MAPPEVRKTEGLVEEARGLCRVALLLPRDGQEGARPLATRILPHAPPQFLAEPSWAVSEQTSVLEPEAEFVGVLHIEEGIRKKGCNMTLLDKAPVNYKRDQGVKLN